MRTDLDFCFVHGQLEAEVLDYTEPSDDKVVDCIAKLGMINGSEMKVRTVPGLPNIELRYDVAVLLDQGMKGFHKDTLFNDDMSKMNQRILAK